MAIPKTQKVVLIEENGGLDVLQYKDFAVPTYEDDEVLVKNKYAGVNYIENYFRKGIYPSQKPYVLGREASGEVVAVGAKVDKFKVGDKVAYLSAGTFSQYQKIKASGKIFKVPEGSSDEDLKHYGSILVQGLTAITFADLAYDIKKGDYVLVYAAAGGVGQILIQLIRQKGAKSIAVASSDEKLTLAQSLGADYLVNAKTDDIVKKVKQYTNGKGANVAFDSVGKDTFKTTLEALAINGRFVSYGNASGKVEAFELNSLPKNIAISRPTVFNYISTAQEFEYYTNKLIEAYTSGSIKFNISKTYPLKEFKEVARLLESRVTTGKYTLEIPN